MAGSLFDQLKRAGLVDDRKARQIKREKHLQRKQGNKGVSAESATDDAATLAAKAAEEKAERDRRLNREFQARQAARAEYAAVRQMIDSHRIENWEGTLAHHFTDASTVKALYVNAETHAKLTTGSVRIARLDGGYSLICAAVAQKIDQRDPDALIPLPQQEASLSEEEREYYAKYEVPDDLHW